MKLKSLTCIGVFVSVIALTGCGNRSALNNPSNIQPKTERFSSKISDNASQINNRTNDDNKSSQNNIILKNANNLEAKANPDDNRSWEAYSSILTGNFNFINEDNYKKEMEYLYKQNSQNGKCQWKYILVDFNKDGINELFIQLTPEHDSAIFSYLNEKIKCISIDDMEHNRFYQPLKDGKLLETYDYNGEQSKTIFEYDSEFKPINKKKYSLITVDDYENYKEKHADMIAKYPLMTKAGEYYFQNIDGNETNLSKEDWDRIQKNIDKQIFSVSEWKDCSELNAK